MVTTTGGRNRRWNNGGVSEGLFGVRAYQEEVIERVFHIMAKVGN